MFSERAMHHVQHPRHEGPLPGATHYAQDGVPGEGHFCEVWLRMPNDSIEDARYKCHLCAGMIASASQMMELVIGRTKEQALLIDDRDLTLVLGGLPEGKEHCPQRAVRALHLALNTPVMNPVTK